MNSNDDYEEWQARVAAVLHEHDLIAAGRAYQQFVARVVDERDDPVLDYHIGMFTRGGDPDGKEKIIEAFDEDPHSYAADRVSAVFTSISPRWFARI